VRSGSPRVGAADEQVQWTCENDERREPQRAAGCFRLEMTGAAALFEPGVSSLGVPKEKGPKQRITALRPSSNLAKG